MRCEGDTDWVSLVARGGGDPNSELGYVAANYSIATGQLTSLSTATELAGGRVRLPLKRFAVATTKPTNVVAGADGPPPARRQTGDGQEDGRGRRQAPGDDHLGHAARSHEGVHERPRPGGPCYPWTERREEVPDTFWRSYEGYAIAILTLGHEAIHLGGTIGGRGPNGQTLGDPQAEAKANCYGMQWMPYVAERLGAAPDDALATQGSFSTRCTRATDVLARAYWSAECRPEGRSTGSCPARASGGLAATRAAGRAGAGRSGSARAAPRAARVSRRRAGSASPSWRCSARGRDPTRGST